MGAFFVICTMRLQGSKDDERFSVVPTLLRKVRAAMINQPCVQQDVWTGPETMRKILPLCAAEYIDFSECAGFSAWFW